MVLAGTCQVYFIDADHFLDIHFVVDHSDLWELRVVETRKNLVDIHLRDTMRRLFEAVVRQVQTQGIHDCLKRFADAVVFLIA